MISRVNNGVSEQEYMKVTEGFVVADDTGSYEFENSPFKRKGTTIPTFYVFKVNEGYPLVLYNNGAGVLVFPKQDFDAMQSKPKIPRTTVERSRDRVAYDLAAFSLVPYDIDPKDSGGWRKIDFLKGSKGFFGASLLYVEHGMTMDFSRVTAQIMPSAVPYHFHNWLLRPHDISSYRPTPNPKIREEGTIRLPFFEARDLTKKVNGLLEGRFRTKLLLNAHPSF